VNSVEQMDSIVRQSLESLAEDLRGSTWTGRREREVVSLFCFGHLLHHCRAGTVLSDPAQLAIEVPVPQIPGQPILSGKETSKAQVCKDTVVWRTARATCWDREARPTVRPLSVIEWTHNQSRMSPYDLGWLCEFSSQVPDFVGYAVTTNRPARGFTLSCTRVFLGKRVDQWIHIS
jgi:hypothetical protein